MANTSKARDDYHPMISSLPLAFPIVSSLEAGLRRDCIRLIEFESALTSVLEESSELANVQGSPADWNIGCQHHWNHVKAVLRRIHRHLAEMHDAVDNSHPEEAWILWEDLQHQESRLAMALSGLQDQAAHLNESAAEEWKKLVFIIQSHRRAVQAGIQGLHLRLHAWVSPHPQHLISDVMTITEFDVDEVPCCVDHLVRLEDLPEIDQATIEIEAEQHQSLGMLDGLKALFMWVDAPQERIRQKNANSVSS